MGVFRKLGNWQTEHLKCFELFFIFQCLICPRKTVGLFEGIFLQIILRNEKLRSFYSHRFEGLKKKICLRIDESFEIRLV